MRVFDLPFWRIAGAAGDRSLLATRTHPARDGGVARVQLIELLSGLKECMALDTCGSTLNMFGDEQFVKTTINAKGINNFNFYELSGVPNEHFMTLSHVLNLVLFFLDGIESARQC